MEIQEQKVPDEWYGTAKRLYLPEYKRWIHINMTIFLSMRVCLTEEDDETSYELNWCLGKNFNLMHKIFEVIEMALKEDITLPICSRIKPLINDPEFLNAIEKRTNIKII